jgi:conjugal transfer pilus assembly protein TraV
MRYFSHVPRSAALLGLLLATSGCAVLGGNVKGNFSCRAPEGDCAPTSVIDGRATETAGEKADDLPAQRPMATTSTSGTLKVVLAAYRDAQGRNHAARVVEVPLPEPAGAQFQDPASRREVARALARAVAAAREPQGIAPPPATDMTDHTNSVLPDVLTAPLQHAPAGGPGTASLPPRVPHPIAGQGEPAPQEGNTP